jgi:hypothetical protein
MNQTDLIILAVYLISVYYVLLQAWYSILPISDSVIKHEGNLYDPESMQDFIDVKFKFERAYPFNKQPTQLEAEIINKSPTATLTIDWEKGSMRDFQGNDRRLIRLVDDLEKGDKGKIQAASTISPKRKISKLLLTAEDLLEANEADILVATKPIVDIQKLAADQKVRPEDIEKDKAKLEAAAARIRKLRGIYQNFITMKEPLTFSVRFQVQITNIIEGARKDLWGFVDCNFTISHARTTRRDQLPWNPPKKK